MERVQYRCSICDGVLVTMYLRCDPPATKHYCPECDKHRQFSNKETKIVVINMSTPTEGGDEGC